MDWIKKKWKWLLPLVALIIVAIGSSFLFLLKSSDVYKMALNKAQNSKVIVDSIGEPINTGFLATGSIKWLGPSGSATISFSVVGPKSKAIIFGMAEKRNGQWYFSNLTAKLSDGQIINLQNATQ